MNYQAVELRSRMLAILRAAIDTDGFKKNDLGIFGKFTQSVFFILTKNHKVMPWMVSALKVTSRISFLSCKIS